MGSAAAYWLANDGQQDVIVLEQFELGHDRGASPGPFPCTSAQPPRQRLRQAYPPPYDNWDRLVSESGQQVLVRTGGVDISLVGTPGEQMVQRYRGVLGPCPHGTPLDRGSEIARGSACAFRTAKPEQVRHGWMNCAGTSSPVRKDAPTAAIDCHSRAA
ncbi:hypothetical protein [Tamaricihabitans halophyticus]|uniref:hypothetical protein n=1 Tax=Tamaricihabitans halophyticus TaxID=1262583 RepID=UPI001FB4FDEF|nr:hypothetical protein [Tamaricihabitans halophyticus]